MLIMKKSLFDYSVIFTPTFLTMHKKSKKDDDFTLKNNDSSFFRAKSKILDYAKNNIFNYFFTCTIDDKKFDINNFVDLKKKILKHFNNFKNRYDNNFKFILVPEYGSKNKRLHFHGLIYTENLSFLKHIGKGIYRDEWFFKNFGANNWQKIKEYNIKCANYISKYINKDLQKIYKCNYFCSRGLNTSKILARVNFDTSINSVYQKQLDFMFSFLSSKGFVKDYDFCSVACLDKEIFNDFLLKCMYNPLFHEKKHQLCFNDLIYCV